MKIKDKLQLDYDGLIEHGAINIVVFGDSVTHGSFEIDVIDYEAVYWNRLRKKLNAVRDYVPVNIIDSGIGGITATASISRVESQVIKHEPDLVIVAFGLNDINDELETYLSSLSIIFDKLKNAGLDVIFMTPNMLNTYVADDAPKKFWDYAHKTAQMQNEGRMDTYMSEAVRLAKSKGVTVCDCYSKWKELAKTQDTTMLLANRINHPTREMHELFAQSLFEIIMS